MNEHECLILCIEGLSGWFHTREHYFSFSRQHQEPFWLHCHSSLLESAAVFWGKSLETCATGRWSKRVQNMGSVYSLECFICGSSCLLLSEACMAVSLLGHVGILDNMRHNSVFGTDYTYLFCFSSSRNTAVQESQTTWLFSQLFNR